MLYNKPTSKNIIPYPSSLSLNKVFLTAITALALSACHTIPTNHDSSAPSESVPTNDANPNKSNHQNFTEDPNRHEYHLSNGLKVIIKEDHRAPIAMTQIWYGVGSTDEPENKGGISHLLEHMMFKGTDKVSGSDFNKLIAKFGGDHNAFTSYDYTGYYEMFPVNRLELALELEADRMTNLNFDSDEFVQEFTQERNVVMEERRQRTDDNPLARAYERFRKLALPDSPKGESIIGPMDEIGNTSIEDLEHWYKTWYAPNNATLVIVGDVTPEDTLHKVEQYFGDIEPKSIPSRPSVKQKGWRGYNQQVIQESVNVPTLLMAFNVPTLPSTIDSDIPSKDAYDLLMLQYVMDGGLAARFEKNLIREQGVLASVYADYSIYERGDSLYMIHATPRENVSLAEAQQAITDEMNRLKTETISYEELERARNNAVKGFVFSQDSVAGQASMIGSMQIRGLDDRLITTLTDELAKVTSDDINKIANKYLVDDNLTVMHIEPSTN